MSYRRIISGAAAAIFVVTCVSDAFAARAVRGGAVARGPHGGTVAYRGTAVRGGGAYRGAGYGAAAVGAAAVGAAAYGSYYNRPQCGYYPYPPCY